MNLLLACLGPDGAGSASYSQSNMSTLLPQYTIMLEVARIEQEGPVWKIGPMSESYALREKFCGHDV